MPAPVDLDLDHANERNQHEDAVERQQEYDVLDVPLGRLQGTMFGDIGRPREHRGHTDKSGHQHQDGDVVPDLVPPHAEPVPVWPTNGQGAVHYHGGEGGDLEGPGSDESPLGEVAGGPERRVDEAYDGVAKSEHGYH